VRDISHEQTQEQSQDVMAILQSLGVAEEAPLIEIWNKIDLLSPEDHNAMVTQAGRTDDLFAVSAVTGEGMDTLLAAIPDKLKDPRATSEITLSFAEGRKRAWLFDAGIVTDETQTETGYDLTVFWTELQRERFARL
jgi:GTP-binding protein HflX